MTFSNTAWAIDGSLLSSSLARRAEYAAVSGAHGIVKKDDLKVTQLGVPGIGILIAGGVGLVTNNYQASPNETYVASNPSSHTVPSGQMPASNPAAKSYIVAVVIGDRDFSQTGHPWMGAGDPPVGQEQTFEYVRPTLIEVSPGATTLNVNYPALVLARIDIPASTTTIINSYITDLRSLARPRQEQQMFVSAAGTWNNTTPVYISDGDIHIDWGGVQFAPSVKVPSWAKRAILVATTTGIRVADTTVNIAGFVKAQLGAVVGPETVFDYTLGSGAIRDIIIAAGSFDVSSIAGTTAIVRIQGYQIYPAVPLIGQRPNLGAGSQQIFDIRFFEE